jgi:hypothetical protein
VSGRTSSTSSRRGDVETSVLRRLIAVVLLMLASATTAHAECAWVLWRDTLSSSAQSYSDPLHAYSKQSECDDGLVKRVDSFSGGPVVVKRRQEVYVTGTEPAHVYRYVCLPDSITPLGPAATSDRSDHGCKWLLWTRESVRYAGLPHITYTSYGTYGDEAACGAVRRTMARHPDTEQRLRHLVGGLVSNSRDAKPLLTRSEGEFTELALYSVNDGEFLAAATFVCLPGTIDPRGVKSK